MKKLLTSLITISILSASAQTTEPINSILKNISADAIRGHMSFLADDLLEGRQPGTRGFALGSKYIETEMIGLGLLPGNGTSYIQQVPLQKGVVDADESSFTIQNGATGYDSGCSSSYFGEPGGEV